MQRRLSLKGGGQFSRYPELAHQKSKSVKTGLLLFTGTLLLGSLPVQANYPSNSLPNNAFNELSNSTFNGLSNNSPNGLSNNALNDPSNSAFNKLDSDPSNDYSFKVKAEAPNHYVVKQGDTLWDISGRYLHNPWQWRDLWATNKQLKNPHLIYPSDTLLLCVIQGNTGVGVDEGEGCSGIERDMMASNIPTDPSTHPKSQQVTITALDNSIPPIPLSTITNWLDKVFVVDPSDFKSTPTIVASQTGSLISGTEDKVYAKGVPLILGQRYGVYRQGEPYIDPISKEVIGLEVRQVATAKVVNVAANGVSSLRVGDSFESEVRRGDSVFVELGSNLNPVFYPKPAEVTRGGKIIRIVDSISRAGMGSVVAIDLGLRDGATAGDIFTVYQRGALIKSVQNDETPIRLPSEEGGQLMVFKPFERMSYAYVLSSELPLNMGDDLLPPVSR